MQFSLILLVTFIFLEPFLPVKAFLWSNISYQFFLWILILNFFKWPEMGTGKRLVFAGLTFAVFFRPSICGLAFPWSNSFYLIILVGTFLISFLGRKEIVWKKTLLDVPIISFLILATGYMFLSLDRMIGLRQVLSMWGAGILYFILVREVKEKAAAENIIMVFFMAALRIMVNGLYQFWLGFNETRLYIEASNQGDLGARLLNRLSCGRVFSNFVYPNAYAGFLIMLIPIIFAFFWMARPAPKGVTRSKKIGAGFLLGLSFVSLYLTYSKGGWLTLALIMLAAFVFLFSRIRIIPKLFIIFLTLILIISMVIVLESTGSTKLGFTKSFKVRWEYWQASLFMIRDNPLRGYGLGNFGEIYARYKLPMAEETQMAHNNYLQVWVEMGAGGFLILLWLVLNFIRLGIFSYHGDPEAHVLSQGLFWGSMAFFVHSFVDFDFYVPNLLFSAFFLIGVTAALNNQTEYILVKNPRPKLLYPLLGILIFWGVLYSQIKYINHLFALDRVESFVKAGDFDRAEQEIDRLLEKSGFNPRLYFEKGRLKESKFFTLTGTGKEKRKSDFIDAVYGYSMASSLNPHRAGYHFSLGRLYWALRDDPIFRKKAISEFRLAHEAYPTKKEYREVFERTRQYSENEK